MKWKINYSRDAEKFIERENIRGETREELSKFIKRTKDKDIIFDVDYKNKAVFIEKIDFRGDVYKK